MASGPAESIALEVHQTVTTTRVDETRQKRPMSVGTWDSQDPTALLGKCVTEPTFWMDFPFSWLSVNMSRSHVYSRWPKVGHVYIPEPIVKTREMEHSDWPNQCHVSIPGIRGHSDPRHITVTRGGCFLKGS